MSGPLLEINRVHAFKPEAVDVHQFPVPPILRKAPKFDRSPPGNPVNPLSFVAALNFDDKNLHTSFVTIELI